MATYTGKQQVEPGLYVRTRKFSVTHIDQSGPLPGTDRDTYYRVPTLVALVTAPLAGLAFVIFIPLIGIGMALWLLGDLALQAIGNAIVSATRVVRPNWAPSVAFLSRHKPAKQDGAEQHAPDAWEETVEKKLEDADRPEQ
jgi:hypothetical protein